MSSPTDTAFQDPYHIPKTAHFWGCPHGLWFPLFISFLPEFGGPKPRKYHEKLGCTSKYHPELALDNRHYLQTVCWVWHTLSAYFRIDASAGWSANFCNLILVRIIQEILNRAKDLFPYQKKEQTVWNSCVRNCHWVKHGWKISYKWS